MMTDHEKRIYQTSEEAFPLNITSDNPNFHNGIGRFIIDKECESNKAKNKNISHYNLWDDFEVIDLIKNTLTKEEYIGALKFNILKYKLRDKGQDESDLIKAKDYQRELNEILEDEI